MNSFMMNAVLTSNPSSPFNISDSGLLLPTQGLANANASSTSLGTILIQRGRAISISSQVSARSAPTPPAGPRQENDRPRQVFQDHTRAEEKGRSVSLTTANRSAKSFRKTSWGTDIPPPLFPSPNGAVAVKEEIGELQEIDLNEDEPQTEIRIRHATQAYQTLPNRSAAPSNTAAVKHDIDRESINQNHHIFHKFVTNFRRKSLRRSKTLPTKQEDRRVSEVSNISGINDRVPRHQKSSSLSSAGFVTAVKTASISVASHSLFTRSRKYNTSRRLQSGTRNSRISLGEGRASFESWQSANTPFQNQGIWERAVKRRNTIEELIISEQSYIADLKVLVNVYFTLLESLPTLSQQTRGSIRKNVEDIIQLHEHLLHKLVVLVPFRLITQDAQIRRSYFRPRVQDETRSRSQSLDVEPRSFQRTISTKPTRKSFDIPFLSTGYYSNYCAEPELAATIAKTFDQMMLRFFAYEEYGSKYQLMVQDSASVSTSIPSWRNYERGIEALANSLASTNNRGAFPKKGLQLGDLLIKPIQRICKYPLLFEDLLRQTPVYDCPESHAELEKVLYRLRETVREINKATDDPTTRTRIEQTWLLQDRLQFPVNTDAMQEQLLRSTIRYKLATQPHISHANDVRMLGHVILCGVLYVAWQGVNEVQGQYLICVLFKSVLLLATSSGEFKYSIVAGLTLADAAIESATSGKGLLSTGALFPWKMIFETENRLFEMIFCAASPKEEEEWTNRLQLRCAAEATNYAGFTNRKNSLLPILALDIKPIANVFGQPGTLARRISTQRSRIVSPCTQVSQVTIRNTHAIKESLDIATTASPNVNGSQSIPAADEIAFLAPRRSERIKLESQLADVWTRAVLPYPGMSARRGEHLIRASASSVMRKLSIASITRRTPSLASLSHITKAEDSGTPDEGPARKNSAESPGARGFGYGSLRRRGDKVIQSLQQGPIELPTRTSSIQGLRRSKSFGVLHSRKASKGKARQVTSVSENDQLPAQQESMKKRWSSPTNMVKSWSTDGFRRFFP